MTNDSLQEVLVQLVEDWNKTIDGSPPLFERFDRQAEQRTRVGE
jgi:hypothetical protein